MSKPVARVFIPCDAAALSVGAEDVAVAILDEARKRKLDIEIVRNGTRGPALARTPCRG